MTLRSHVQIYRVAVLKETLTKTKKKVIKSKEDEDMTGTCSTHRSDET